MTKATGVAHGARRRRALSLPVIGSTAAIIVILIAAVFLSSYLNGKSSDESRATVESAKALYDKGDYSGAESALSGMVAEDADDLEARRVLALALAAQGKNEEAIAQYEAIVKADPKDDASLYGLATLEQLMGDASGSIAHYEAAVAIEPDAQYVASLAAVYSTVGRWADAVTAWEEYLQTAELNASQQGRVYDSIASAYENAREYDKAKEALQQALSLDPNNTQYKARLEAYEG